MQEKACVPVCTRTVLTAQACNFPDDWTASARPVSLVRPSTAKTEPHHHYVEMGSKSLSPGVLVADAFSSRPLLLVSLTVSCVVSELEPRHSHHQQLGNKTSQNSLSYICMRMYTGPHWPGTLDSRTRCRKRTSERKTSATILTATRIFFPFLSQLSILGLLGERRSPVRCACQRYSRSNDTYLLVATRKSTVAPAATGKDK